MSKKIDKIKEELVGEVFSITELENYISKFYYNLIETEDEETDNVVKFTNYKSQIWITYSAIDENGNMLIDSVKSISRTDYAPTRVEPFRTYEDLEAVLNYFKDHQMYHHWLTGWLMATLGRRVGDTLALRWCDLYKGDWNYRERLTTLKEEKTDKIVGVRFNIVARLKVEEYISLSNINIEEQKYLERIFDNTAASFRKALKQAINAVGLTYPLSTHSFRKYYANTLYKLHPQDVDNLSIVQTVLGHSNQEITKVYLCEIDRKIDKYNEDYSNYLMAKMSGQSFEISDCPVVTLKTQDIRNILSQCWDMAQSGSDKFKGINQLIGMVEGCMV